VNQDQPESYAQTLGKMLKDRGRMFACAESCTGGLLSAAMTHNAGSSQWFDRGFVTYSNIAKVEQLQVSADTLEHFGAVSEETAMEMAAGVLNVAGSAHLAVSITGIAGPDGGTPGKPVGMVCFGFAQRAASGVGTRAMTRTFEGERDEIRAEAVIFALRTAIELVGQR
jgi:nicotinamide-nucleotide amidase